LGANWAVRPAAALLDELAQWLGAERIKMQYETAAFQKNRAANNRAGKSSGGNNAARRQPGGGKT